MRIIVFNWRDLKHTWAGGGEVCIFEIASRWVKMGHEVILFCGQDIENNLPFYEKIKGIHVYRKGGRFSLYFWAAWHYLTLLKQKADIVVDVENGIPFFTPFFSRTPKLCYVHHVHGRQFFYEFGFPLNYIGFLTERHIFPIVYKHLPTIAVSHSTKEELIKIGFHKKNISIVYNGMYKKNKKRKELKKYAHPTILFLGRIKKYKRVDLLVKSFKTIVEKVPNARLIIAGWGTDAFNITDLVMKNNLRRKIILRGPVSSKEKQTLLAKSWVYVNPSIGEGWSLGVIEANAEGTPAIGFDVPGLSESILNGKTGFLVKNEKELIQKICKLLNNKQLAEKMGKKATNRVQDFNWDRAANESIHILEKIQLRK